MQVIGQSKTLGLKQGLSSSFKGVSRDKKPSWGNRFVRDHNDLIYDANPESISNKLKPSVKQKKTVQNQEEVVSPSKKYEYSPFKQRELIKTSQSSRNLNQGISPFRYLKDMQQYQTKTRVGIETAGPQSRRNKALSPKVATFNQYGLEVEIQARVNNQPQNNQKAQGNVLGLSQFEYQKTIQGKMKSRNNHHIDFQKSKTCKIDNKNKVWYDYSKDIKRSQSLLQKQKQNNLVRVHPFKSYSAHKLFFKTKRMSEDNGCGFGGLLDKIYDTSPLSLEMTREKVVKDVVNYRVMTNHPALTKKLGTNLDYEVQKVRTLGLGNQKKPVLELCKTQRKLVFSRQVISPTRGCFR